MTEKDREKLLAWRPQSTGDVVPQDVYDARMSLLCDEDAKALTKEFNSGRDATTAFLYFGGDMFGNLGSNASGLMTRCVYVGKDAETSLRLFKGSAYASRVDEKHISQMLDEALEFVEEFRPVMAKMGRETWSRHTNPHYMTYSGMRTPHYRYGK